MSGKITKEELKKVVEEVFREQEEKKDRKINILKYATPQQIERVNRIFKEEVDRQLAEYKAKETRKFKIMTVKDVCRQTEDAEQLRAWWECPDNETYQLWIKTRNMKKNKQNKSKNKQ